MADGVSGLNSPTVALVTADALSLASTGDKAVIAVPFKCEVYKVFVLSTHADAGAATVVFDKRPTGGSDAGRGSADVGSITKSASNQQGKYLYETPATRVTLKEGEQVVVEVTSAGGTGSTFSAGILVREVPEVAANNSNMVAA